MARQYDVEDLLNSDASDPDGEAIPVATNDEVQEGKFIVETAAGTGKIGNVSQIVADYLQKSAGFYTEVRPYYIVRPAPGDAWTGTWQLFLHGLDDGGLSDAANITIGINGVVVHTAPWTASAGARDIAFSISETESTALTASSPTGSNVRCYVAFHDSEGNEIVIRHFTLKLLAAVPKIPDAEIPDDIARDDEVTAAIAAALAAHPSPFSDSIDLGVFENANGGAIAGHYVRNSNTQLDISHTNIANEDKSQAINGIQAGFGLVFGEKIFVVEWTNNNSGYREFNGFWAGGDPDTTAESSQISIKVITHELRMIRFMTSAQVKALVPEIQQAFDKTVDIHLYERPGDFVNMNDAAVAGISLIENTNANRNALNARTYNFAALTWQPTSVDIPNDGNEYWVVVRVAKSAGSIETQFQLINNDPLEGTEHLRFSRQDDANWRYYQVTADSESVWTLQRRATATHTRWDAPLGDLPIRQVQALIPDVPENEGLTPQQKAQFDSLVAKTADLILETRETWVAATDASFLALPADNAQLARVRSGNVPQGLTGWTTDVTTTDARVILIRVPIAAQLADYRILLGDDNAVRLDTYAVNATDGTYAYMTSTSLILLEASRIRLQHHGNNTHTRFIGMLAESFMERLLPLLPDDDDRDGKVPQFSGNDLTWQVLSGGGLTSDQVTAIANARAAARFTDAEKTKLASAIIDTALATALQPYGLGFIGIYPRYMRFDQLEENIIIAFGEIHEPYDEANRIEVSFNGVQVVRTEFSPSTRFFRFGIESSGVNNIRNNTDLAAQHWNVQITFFKDGFLDANVIGNIRTIPVIINRESEPPDVTAIQSQLSRAANWADIPNDTNIPANYIAKDSGRYFGAKIAHTKTAGHVAPAGDPTNWIELSNQAATSTSAPPVPYIELNVNSGLTIPLSNAAAIPLTYTSTLAKSNENTGVITRNSAGNAIDLAAGTYSVQTHIVTSVSGNQGRRSNMTVEIYEGTNLLDRKQYLDYNRGQGSLSPQSFSSDHLFTISSAKTIQIRVKRSNQESGTQATIATTSDGTVTIKKE